MRATGIGDERRGAVPERVTKRGKLPAETGLDVFDVCEGESECVRERVRERYYLTIYPIRLPWIIVNRIALYIHYDIVLLLGKISIYIRTHRTPIPR